MNIKTLNQQLRSNLTYYTVSNIFNFTGFVLIRHHGITADDYSAMCYSDAIKFVDIIDVSIELSHRLKYNKGKRFKLTKSNFYQRIKRAVGLREAIKAQKLRSKYHRQTHHNFSRK